MQRALSLGCDCEKLHHTVNSDTCHMEDQLGHKKGATKAPSAYRGLFLGIQPEGNQ